MFEWSEEKNLLLIESRGISFEDVVMAIGVGNLLADEPHFNQNKYPNQGIFYVLIKNYVYCVPYVKNDNIFLKTIYPSRKATKKFLKDKKWKQ